MWTSIKVSGQLDSIIRINRNVFLVFRNESENTAGLVTVSKSREEIVVAFRGTNNFRNVQRDFAAKARSFDHVPEGMKIHTGFHKVTMSLYYQVSYSNY